MRNAFIVSYDICEPKRWRKVFEAMHGYGSHIQYSVFRCELSKVDKVRMMAKVEQLIHHGEDQVLVIDLGPADGRGGSCIEAIGKKLPSFERGPIIV